MKVRKKLKATVKILFGLFLIFTAVFPIYWLVSLSIRPTEEMTGHIALIPKALTTIHFYELFYEHNFGTALINSLQTTIVAVSFSLVIGICAAYVIARSRFSYSLKKPISYWILLIRILPPVAFTVPLYIMFNNIGILNTKIPAILACILIDIPLVIWFLISFVQDIPESMEESSKIDGASEFQIFIKIVLPLLLPGIAAVTMLSFMYAWNEYTYSVIFVQTQKNFTIPLALAGLNNEDSLTNFGLVAAGGVISVIPVLLFVIFAQNYLISGLSSGAVKE